MNLLIKATVKINTEPSPWPYFDTSDGPAGNRKEIIRRIKSVYKGILTPSQITKACMAIIAGNYVSIHIKHDGL